MKYRATLLHWGRSLLTVAAVLFHGSMWAQGNFVYTNDDQPSNTVSAFSVGSDGTLTAIAGSPFSTNGVGFRGGPFATNRIGIAVMDNFLFVSNTGSDNVSVFNINPRTGGLTPVAGSPFATRSSSGDLGIAVSTTPDGRYLVATNTGSNNITVFSLASNGILSRIVGSPFPTLKSPDGIRISPDGKFLAVAETAFPPSEETTNQVENFSIAQNGTLTSLGAFAGGGTGSLTDVDIDCSSSFLYGGEANDTNTIVDAYSIASYGSLTAISGSPFLAGPGDNSNVVLLSPDDKTLFVSNQFSDTITAFSVPRTAASLSSLVHLSRCVASWHFRSEWPPAETAVFCSWLTITKSELEVFNLYVQCREGRHHRRSVRFSLLNWAELGFTLAHRISSKELCSACRHPDQAASVRARSYQSTVEGKNPRGHLVHSHFQRRHPGESELPDLRTHRQRGQPRLLRHPWGGCQRGRLG